MFTKIVLKRWLLINVAPLSTRYIFLHKKIYTCRCNWRHCFFVQSGTTGPPKGVMLNHDNLTWISHVVATHLEVREGRDTFLSYLPMSHVAAQVCFSVPVDFVVITHDFCFLFPFWQIIDLYCPLSIGGTVYFAQPDALKVTWLLFTLYLFPCLTVLFDVAIFMSTRWLCREVWVIHWKKSGQQSFLEFLVSGRRSMRRCRQLERVPVVSSWSLQSGLRSADSSTTDDAWRGEIEGRPRSTVPFSNDCHFAGGTRSHLDSLWLRLWSSRK